MYNNYYDYGYDYGMSSAAGMISSILIILLLIGLASIVLMILMFIGQWKCFKKAGYKGWETLIGGHNQFVNCTFAGVNPVLVLGVMFGSVVTIIPIIGWLAYLGFLIYYQVVVGINTAKVFGKGTGFGIALAIPLSAPIAWFLLGKDDVKYVGLSNDNMNESSSVPTNPVQPEPIVPVVPVVEPMINPIEQQIQPVQPEIQVQEPVNPMPLFCTNCGGEIIPGAKFCTKCGNRL